MKLSLRASCGWLFRFEEVACRCCGAPQGFVPATLELTGLATGEDGAVIPDARPGEAWRRCANAATIGRTWPVPEEAADPRCDACRINRNLADVAVPANREKWRLLECAKRRLLYALRRFGLPIASKKDGEARGLAFDFVEGSRGAPVMTGHADGLITVNISEADSAERERQRLALGEPYRPLLGHMRHEAGHYHQEVLVTDAGRTEDCRAVFGDESESYADAVKHYYEQGPNPGWEEADPCHPPSLESLTRAWLPLTAAVNGLDRSMGQPDLYPFDPSPRVLEKVRFVHDLFHRAGNRPAAAALPA